MEIYTTAFVNEANQELDKRNIPLRLYNTDKLHLLRIKKLKNGKKIALRNGGGKFIQNRFAVFYIGKILEGE